MNIANKLTISRMLMVPVFMAAFYLPWAYWYWPAAILFVAAFATDMLDGHLARSRNMVTNFGKFMDPIADKLLTMAALVMLTARGNLSPIVAVIILAREFVVSGLRLVAAGSGRVIAAGWLGKAKTMLQFIMLLLFLLEPVLRALAGAGGAQVVLTIVTLLTVLITLWSGVDYIWSNRQFINPRK